MDEPSPAAVLAELAAALNGTALLDAPFTLTPPPVVRSERELAAQKAREQPALPWDTLEAGPCAKPTT